MAGQQVPVHEAFATVELTPDGALAYVGTGFRAGVSLPDKPTSVDEQKAAEIAIKDYEVQEKVSAASTLHREPGLMVHAPQGVLLVPWKGDTLAYQIHAEAKDPKGGFSRPFMYLIDAFSGTILARRQAWVE